MYILSWVLDLYYVLMLAAILKDKFDGKLIIIKIKEDLKWK